MDIDTLTRNRLEGGRTMITGGHFGFDKQGHPQLNEGTLYSFKEAVRLYAEANDSSLGLGLLVNDIGTTCGPKACSLKGGSISREDFVLPDEYLAILAKHSVPETDVHLFWEKHLRNRAKKLYRKDHDLDKMREVYLGRNPADIPLFRYHGGRDDYVAACPAIMGAFHAEQERRGYGGSINLYSWGPGNRENIPNVTAISKGTFVADRLHWSKSDHANFFCLSDEAWQDDAYLEQLQECGV